MYYILVAELTGEYGNKAINLKIDQQEKISNADINIQNSDFLKIKGEYYAFIINETKLMYLGYSNNFNIPMIPLKEYIESNNNPIIPFRLNPIEKSLSKLNIGKRPDKETFGEIIGELKAIDITDNIFKHEEDFCILVK